MDAQLTHSIAHRLDVASMTLGQSIQSRRNQRSGTLILETRSPLPERLSLLELDHM